MPRAKLRTEELKERVLDVALSALESEGVLGFTTRRIAEQAGTSLPAVYELFGDKAGLVRELYFEGFRRLRACFEELDTSADPRADLVALLREQAKFARQHPALAEVMYSRPFADFDPGPVELKAGNAVRRAIVGRVRRCLEVEVMAGDETDIAHVLLAMVQGLMMQERAGWLGRTQSSIVRRWNVGINAAIDGFKR